MKIQIKAMQISGMKYAVPVCDQARKACELVKQPFLTCEQVKLLELMGCNIETINEEELREERKTIPILKTIKKWRRT